MLRPRPHLCAALLALGLVVLPGASRAQELSLNIVGSAQRVPDDAIYGFGDDNGFGYGDFSLGVRVWEGLSLFAEYHTGAENSDLFSTLSTNLRIHGARLGLQYRYDMTRWLHPYVLVGFGAYWGDIDLEAATQTYDDTDFGVGGYALGGFELVWYFGEPGGDRARDHLGIGVLNDYGYNFGPNLEFGGLRPETGGGGVDLGEVNLSGFTWRVGLTLRYVI